MTTAQQQRDAARDRKRQERSRYKDAGLAEVLCRIPNTPEAIAKLRNLEVKLRNKG